MSKWTGSKVRELRHKRRLSRKEFAELLNVAAVTVEKWEQRPDTPIREKYLHQLDAISDLDHVKRSQQIAEMMRSISRQLVELAKLIDLYAEMEEVTHD